MGSGEMKIMVYKISLWLILTSFVGLLVACDSAVIDGKEPNGKSQFISKKSAVTDAINELTKAARLRHATISIQPSQYYLNADRLFLKLTRPNGDTLFVGEIQRRIDSDISVMIPEDDRFINYELFTSSAYDLTITGKFLI